MAAEADSWLAYMITEPQIIEPVGQLLDGLQQSSGDDYTGPLVPVGVAQGAYPAFGECKVILHETTKVHQLFVDDSFPHALERAGVPEDAAWYTAAVFGGLVEAISARALARDAHTLTVLKLAGMSGENQRYWYPDKKAGAIAINRLAAGLALGRVGIDPNSLDLPLMPPYPNHVAAFIDPLVLPRPRY